MRAILVVLATVVVVVAVLSFYSPLFHTALLGTTGYYHGGELLGIRAGETPDKARKVLPDLGIKHVETSQGGMCNARWYARTQRVDIYLHSVWPQGLVCVASVGDRIVSVDSSFTLMPMF